MAFQEVESKAAAERVFDPARYTVEIEARASAPALGRMRRPSGLTVNAQRTASRDPGAWPTSDWRTSPRCRSATRPALGRWTSSCAWRACADPRAVGAPQDRLHRGRPQRDRPVLLQQVPVLEHWIDQRAGEAPAFRGARRLQTAASRCLATRYGPTSTTASPANADLAHSLRRPGRAATRATRLHRLHRAGPARGQRPGRFRESRYPGESLSDHCAAAVTPALGPKAMQQGGVDMATTLRSEHLHRRARDQREQHQRGMPRTARSATGMRLTSACHGCARCAGRRRPASASEAVLASPCTASANAVA